MSAAVAADAGAEEEAATVVEPVFVTSSRLGVEDVATAQIDSQRIEAQQPASALDALRLVPGVSISQPAGGIAEVFLRGAESNFTAVLIDGVRANDPSNARGGGFDFSTLDAMEIERVEVHPNALSAIHGSEAMAGVINIRTQRPTAELERSTRVEVGADDFTRASARIAGPLSSSVRAQLRGGYTNLAEPYDGSEQQLRSGQADVEYSDAEHSFARLTLRHAQRDRAGFADASGGPLYAVDRQLETADARETSVAGQYSRALTDAWSMDVLATHFSRDEQVETPAIAPGVFDAVPASTSDTQYERSQLVIGHRLVNDRAWEVGAGVDLQHEEGDRTGTLDLGFMTLPSEFDLQRTSFGAYAEGLYRPLRGLALQGGIRVDDTEEENERASGQFAVTYALASELTLHARWSNGFKHPSFYALGDTLVGNPDLRAETSESIEVGVQQAFASRRFVAALNAFSARYDDLIDFDFTTFRLVNRSRVRIEGVEVQTEARLSDAFSLAVHATFSDIELDEPEAVLLYRPEDYGAAVLTWHATDRWTFNASAQVVGSREASSVPTGPRRLSGYERFDLTAGFRWSDAVHVFAAIDNVLDDDYQEALGFASSGAQFRAGARLSF